MFKVEPILKEIAEKQLTQRRARKPEEPARPVTTVHSKALYGLQFRATVEGHSFISDEGDKVGGRDAGPAPLRYFLAGTMMCHQVWCVKSAALLDVQLDRLEGEIAGYIEAGSGAAEQEDARGFGRIAYKVTVDSPNPAEAIQSIVEAATRRCPAFVTVARSTPIDLTIVHNGVNLGERQYGKRVT
jgi:putative redox protein